MSWLIYKHTSPSNKVYIGQTRKTAEERWRSGKGYTNNKNTRFSKAIQKYGWDSFKHEIIEDSIKTQEEANNRERYWISKYNSYDFDCGYNMTPGGDSIGFEAVAKAKETIQRIKREKYDFIVCYELMKTFVNPTIALEWFVNNGYENNYKKKNPILRVLDKENMTCFGFHFCRIINVFEYKPKSKSESNKRKGRTKKIICVDTGDIYDSLSDCSRMLNIYTQHLSRACKKHCPTHNLYFSYLDDFDETTWRKYEREKIVPKNAKSVFCLELNKEWDTMADCCNELGITTGALSVLLSSQDALNIYKTLHNFHFCFTFEKDYATIVERPTTRKNSTGVFCVEKNELYDSITEAEKAFNIKNILKCCKDWKYTSGGYHWCFEKDIDCFEIKPQIGRKNRNGLAKRVVNIDTGEEYDTLSDASKAINRNTSTLCEAIKKGLKCAGCHWKYLEK